MGLDTVREGGGLLPMLIVGPFQACKQSNDASVDRQNQCLYLARAMCLMIPTHRHPWSSIFDTTKMRCCVVIVISLLLAVAYHSRYDSPPAASALLAACLASALALASAACAATCASKLPSTMPCLRNSPHHSAIQYLSQATAFHCMLMYHCMVSGYR